MKLKNITYLGYSYFLSLDSWIENIIEISWQVITKIQGQLFFFILQHSLIGTGVFPPSPHIPSPPLCSPLQGYIRCLSCTLRSPSYCDWGASQQCRRLSAVSLRVHPYTACMGHTSLSFYLWKFHLSWVSHNGRNPSTCTVIPSIPSTWILAIVGNSDGIFMHSDFNLPQLWLVMLFGESTREWNFSLSLFLKSQKACTDLFCFVLFFNWRRWVSSYLAHVKLVSINSHYVNADWKIHCDMTDCH